MSADEFNHDDDIDIEVASGGIRKGSFVERILSPESLQRMMACGGGLLVVGFVVWLWSIGIFSNPVTVAGLIGSVTVGMIGAGTFLHGRTRYRLAGTGLTLLGSLALPLNLWFYDAQGLITLENGGHLWIPAAVCCVIYTGVAWIMRNARFVYAVVGGVVMTGMLFLADASINQFWYLLPQVTFLTGLGWTCLVAARQFPEGDGDFSRSTFGRAFSRAGGLVLTSGLLLLAGGQVAATLSTKFAAVPAPLIATLRSQQLWAVGILLGSAAGFAVEHLLRKSRSGFGAASVLTGLWGGVTLIEVLGIWPSASHLLIGLSVLATAVNLWGLRRRLSRSSADEKKVNRDVRQGAHNAVEPLAILLAVTAVVSFVGQFFTSGGNLLFSPTGWTLVTQLFTTSAAVLTTVPAVWSQSREGQHSVRPQSVLVFLGAGAVTLALWTTAMTLGWTTIVPYIVVSLLLPTVCAVLACALPNESTRACLRLASWGSLNTGLLVLAGFTATGLLVAASPHLVACGVLGVAALVFYLTAASQGRATDSFFGHVTAGLSFSQALVLAGFNASYSLALAPALIGTVLAVASRLFRQSASGDVSENVPVAPNLLVLFGNAVGVLLAGSRLVTGEQTFGLIGMLSVQLAATTAVGLMARSSEWKMAFRTAAAALVVTFGFAVDGLMNVSWYHRLELASLLSGTALLVLGYVAWSREGDDRDGVATAGLTFGSLATVIPLAVGLVCCRLADTGMMTVWRQFHEVGALAVGVVLLGSGLLCRIRSTTVGGASLLAVFIVSLVTLVHWPEQLQSISVLMMLGGGAFFSTAILLSIYRDRLLEIPARIKEGDGVFRVFKWR